MNPIIIASHFSRMMTRCHANPSQHTKQTIHHLKTIAVSESHINPNCGLNQAHIRAEFDSPTDKMGVATIKFPQSAENILKFQNSARALHGATQFALHDLAACHALHQLGYEGATKSVNIAYVAPAEAKYIHQAQAVATIKAIRGKSAHITSDLYINHKTLVSTAQMIFSVWKPNDEHK